MATNAAQPEDLSDDPSAETIKRWQELFFYLHSEAVELTKQRRADFTRNRVADTHWTLVQAQMEDKGYDREANEHMLDLGGVKAKKSSTAQVRISPLQVRSVYLPKLESALDTVKKVQNAGGLMKTPTSFKAQELMDKDHLPGCGATKVAIKD
jgi:hypothetical protein